MKYQARPEAARLVFIDETWVKTNMAPLRGWFARGKRLKAKVPHGHWKTMTFIAALRHDLRRAQARMLTMTLKGFAPLSRAVSIVVRTSASASAAHMAR